MRNADGRRIFRKGLPWLLIYALCAFAAFLNMRIWWIGSSIPLDRFVLLALPGRVLRPVAFRTVFFFGLLLLTGFLLGKTFPPADALSRFRKCFRFLLYAGILGWLSIFSVAPFMHVTPVLTPLLIMVTAYLIFRTYAAMYRTRLDQIRRAGALFIERLPSPALWVFVFALCFHGVALFRVALPVRNESRDYLLAGDQPTYLYMAHSLVHTRSLDVSETILPVSVWPRTGDAHAGGVRRHNPHLTPGTEAYEARAAAFGDAHYSTHRPGTSFIIAPFYALGDLAGDYHRFFISLFLVVLVALAFREITIGALRCVPAHRPAAVIFSALAVTLLPVSVMATAIFPQTIMFFVMARLLRLTLEDNLHWRHNLEISAWFAFSPWLNDQYGLWCLPFFAWRLIRLWPSWKACVLPALPFAVSAFFMARFNLLLYGHIRPAADPLGAFLPVREALAGGIPGVWFDWGYGLVMLAPIAILLPAGLVCGCKLRANQEAGFNLPVAAAMGMIVLVAAWITGTWWCWWGGFAPPNRFMLPLLPIAILSAVLYSVHIKGVLPVVLWVFSGALGVEAMLRPELWYSRVLPARTIPRLVRWDFLLARFPPFHDESLAFNTPAVLVSILGILAGAILVMQAVRIRRSCAWVLKAGIWVLLCGVVLMAHINTYSKVVPVDSSAHYIPFSMGAMREPTVEQDGDAGAYTLRTELFMHEMPGRFALSLHYLGGDRTTLLDQFDFDLNVYLREKISGDPARIRAWNDANTLRIQKTLPPPPRDARYARIQLYDPGGPRDFRPQIRTRRNLVRLPDAR